MICKAYWFQNISFSNYCLLCSTPFSEKVGLSPMLLKRVLTILEVFQVWNGPILNGMFSIQNILHIISKKMNYHLKDCISLRPCFSLQGCSLWRKTDHGRFWTNLWYNLCWWTIRSFCLFTRDGILLWPQIWMQR